MKSRFIDKFRMKKAPSSSKLEPSEPNFSMTLLKWVQMLKTNQRKSMEMATPTKTKKTKMAKLEGSASHSKTATKIQAWYETR